jgi:hypothetical protein
MGLETHSFSSSSSSAGRRKGAWQSVVDPSCWTPSIFAVRFPEGAAFVDSCDTLCQGCGFKGLLHLLGLGCRGPAVLVTLIPHCWVYQLGSWATCGVGKLLEHAPGRILLGRCFSASAHVISDDLGRHGGIGWLHFISVKLTWAVHRTLSLINSY